MKTEQFGRSASTNKPEMKPIKANKAQLRPEKAKQKNSWKRSYMDEDEDFDDINDFGSSDSVEDDYDDEDDI
jgi:hypothetical protein